ncbi:MAG: GAF domain-containing protein, partial [Limisphaerales bacterium]
MRKYAAIVSLLPLKLAVNETDKHQPLRVPVISSHLQMNPSTHADAEANRLKALQLYHILDTPPEEGFDELTRLAAQVCGAPIALVSFADKNRLWVKSRVGYPLPEIPRKDAICNYAMDHKGIFVVENVAADERFKNLPLVVGGPKVRFFAGTNIRGKINQAGDDGQSYPIGALCVMDVRPRTLSAEQSTALETIARQVMAQ